MTYLPLPSQEYLLSVFSYDPESGELTWRVNRGSRGRAGTLVLGIGIRQLGLDGEKYHKNRIIWKMVTGEDPPDTVDHRDGNPANSRWKNLRLATRTQQNFNTDYEISRASKTGHCGVYYGPNGTFWVELTVEGHVYKERGFKDLISAVTARKRLEEIHQQDYAYDRR